MKQDILLGNNFLDFFKVRIIKPETISLLTPCNKWIVLKRILHLYPLTINNIKTNIDNNLEILKQKYLELLKINFGGNSITLWEKEKIYAKIELINPNDIVRSRPLRYSPDDQKEFEVQLKELLELNLIQESKSPHSSPTFLVRKHNEQKKRKS